MSYEKMWGDLKKKLADKGAELLETRREAEEKLIESHNGIKCIKKVMNLVVEIEKENEKADPEESAS